MHNRQVRPISHLFFRPNTPLIVIEMEQELATVVYQFCERVFPFTGKRLKKLAYELAVANKRKGFSPKKLWQADTGLKGSWKDSQTSRKKCQKPFYP